MFRLAVLNLLLALFSGQTKKNNNTHFTKEDAPRTSINTCIVGGVLQPMMDFISGMCGPTKDTRLEAQAASIPISFHMIIPNFTADGFSLRQTAAAKCQSTDENAARWGEKVKGGGVRGQPTHSTSSPVFGIRSAVSVSSCRMMRHEGHRGGCGCGSSSPAVCGPAGGLVTALNPSHPINKSLNILYGTFTEMITEETLTLRHQ